MHTFLPARSPETEIITVETLMAAYYPDMLRLAMSILRDMDDAEDAAQESFIAAASALSSFRADSSPRTWLYSITVHTCLSLLRKRKARQALAHTLRSLQAIVFRSPSVEEQTAQHDQDDCLWAAVNRLDEKHRLPLLLLYMYDLPVLEIAQILGVGEGTVHSRLYYARKKLLKQLEGTSLYSEEVREVPQ